MGKRGCETERVTETEREMDGGEERERVTEREGWERERQTEREREGSERERHGVLGF